MNTEKTYADYIDQKGLAELQALEKELGRTILAYRTPPKFADLTKEQVTKLAALEKKLCVRLVAYDTH